MTSSFKTTVDEVAPDTLRGSRIRILELRCADGSGGGPEKTILFGAKSSDSSRFAVIVCYVRDIRDRAFDIAQRAARLGIDYVEVVQRHALDPRIVGQARRVVEDRFIDIVHAHDYKTNLLALLLARQTGVVPLSTAHGYTGHSWRERRLYYPLDRRLLRRFPLIITVSEHLRGELIRANAKPERVRTILNGIDHESYRWNPDHVQTARAKFGIQQTDFVIGAIGRAEIQKRFDLLLEAIAALRSRHPDLRLIIAGDGTQRTRLQELATQLGVFDICRFLGHCPSVEPFYHAVDLVVQSSDYEGTANTVLEAMAFERPIVATDVGGTAELLQHGVHGLLVKPGDSRALTHAIELAIQDTPSTRRKAELARHRVENELSFQKRMRSVESIYAELMQQFRCSPRKPKGH